MTKASRAGAAETRRSLPEEIAVWEILVRLPPKSLLRCRAVCRAWRHATSTSLFLLDHHRRQPSLPIVSSSEFGVACQKTILSFDHRAAGADLQPVAQLNDSFCVEASCDGLLVLSKHGNAGACCFSLCNPATRQHASLPQLSRFGLLGMYPHRPTGGEYRLLLQQTIANKIGCYVYTLGSDKPPRYIGWLELAAFSWLLKPVLVRDSMHWYPVHYRSDPQQEQAGSKVLIVFDTISESFRQMSAPFVPAKSYIVEMDGTLGIYNYASTLQIVDIWMLGNYQSEVWRHMYSVKLPTEEIRRRFGRLDYIWYVSAQSVDGDLLLLVSSGGCLFHVDVKGKLVKNFHLNGQHVYPYTLQLKQTLVQHTFFTALEGHDSPFF